MKRLRKRDWFFNAMVVNVLRSLNYRWWGEDYVRTDTYWNKAGFTRLVKFKSEGGTASDLIDRELADPTSNHQQQILALIESEDLSTFTRRTRRLYPSFHLNSQIWYKYFNPDEYHTDLARFDIHRIKIYKEALKKKDRLSGDTFDCIHADFAVRGLSLT
ncbi:hypothetical protein [Haloferula sargassicola]|uniref:Uncharacterized protein n=1 Tax=Haloferula sargassicola TaxID=490096 RepID=A0ABP9UWL3_9BACT